MFPVYLEVIILMLELFKKSKSINRKDRKNLNISVLTLSTLRILSVLCG